MVDYEDLEPMGNWSDSLREQLIDRKTGSQNYDSIVLTPDDAYLIEQRRTWYFRPISKTAYTYNIFCKFDNIILKSKIVIYCSQIGGVDQ
jgi:hypothetical protein